MKKQLLCALVALALLLPCSALAGQDRLRNTAWRGSRDAGYGITTDITLVFGDGAYHLHETHAASGETISDFDGTYIPNEQRGMYVGDYPVNDPRTGETTVQSLQFFISDDSQSLSIYFGSGLTLSFVRDGESAGTGSVADTVASEAAKALLHGVWLGTVEEGGQYVQALMIFEEDHVHYIILNGPDANAAVLGWSLNGDTVTLTYGGAAFDITVNGDTIEYDLNGEHAVFTRISEL